MSKNPLNGNSMKGKEPPLRRLKYEDHRLSFSNWVDHLGSEKTWFGRVYLILNERYHFWRFLGLFLFSFLTAYAVMFEVRTPLNFQVGEITKVDVVSPASFEFIDELTTEEKRDRAEEAIPVIFDFDPFVFDRVSNALYLAFRNMKLHLKNVKWPSRIVDREEVIKEFFIHKSEFDKDLNLSVPDYIFEWLVENRFGARFENIVIENLRIWYQGKIVENLEKTILPTQNVILARTVAKNNKGREFSVKRTELLDVGSRESFPLKNLKKNQLNEKDKENLEKFSQLLLYPNLTLNKQEMASRRQAARETVLPVTIAVKKNQTIVVSGSKIEPMHLQIFSKIESLRSDRRHGISLIMMAFSFFTIIFVFRQYLGLSTYRQKKIDFKDMVVLGVIVITTLVVVKFFLFVTEASFSAKFGDIIPVSVFLYAAPFAMGSMLAGLLMTREEIVLVFTAFMAVVMGLLTEFNFSFFLVCLVGGIAGARGVFNCKKRNDIYWAGVRVGLVNAAMIAMLLTVLKLDQKDYVRELLYSTPAGFLSGIFSAMMTMIVVPFLEGVFNYTTDVKLLELSNLNHPLLKEMIVKSPGTYHHSMLVGSMVEAAAEEIGANSLLGKVISYYHDIGKMNHSDYFIENQKSGQNPHDHISPYMSRTLLVSHVKDGVELGKTYKLGKPIIDGIIQHHGTTLMSYFYNKAVDIRAEGNLAVSEEEFRYPGPKPQFREVALCMLADSIEAAARSLDEPTPVRLQNIVRNIVQRKFLDGQLDECSLTLRELSKVEQAFTRILLGVYHQRIDYPRSAGGGASGESIPLTSFFGVQGQKR